MFHYISQEVAIKIFKMKLRYDFYLLSDHLLNY